MTTKFRRPSSADQVPPTKFRRLSSAICDLNFWTCKINEMFLGTNLICLPNLVNIQQAVFKFVTMTFDLKNW